jgi:tellurite resistance protein TehA-like permease
LSFTRDSTVVVLAAMGWVVLAMRTRRSGVVLGTGVVASVPAFALFGAPLVSQLSYVLQGFHPPTVVSWSYVLHHYPAALSSVLRQDAHYPLGLSFPVFWFAVAAVLLAALVYMFVASPRGDPFFMLSKGAFVGAAALIVASINYTGLRIELVFIPSIAVALALAVARLLVPVREWLSRHGSFSSPAAVNR